MKIISLVAVVAAVSSGSALAGTVDQFGTLTDGYGSAISFDAGTGNSNTNFMYQNQASNGGFLTMGLSTQVHFGGSPITNNGADTFYASSGANQSGNPSAQPGSGSWAFKWSVTFSDNLGGSGLDDYRMAFRIEGPSGGSWGSLNSAFATELNTSSNDYENQQVWVPSYDFMQVDSATAYGPTAAGAWSGLGYNFDELGAYSISIKVWDNSLGNMTEVGMLTMSTEVVPGVGGLAALGGLGLVGRRRRR
jgi:hypothetical protein